MAASLIANWGIVMPQAGTLCETAQAVPAHPVLNLANLNILNSSYLAAEILRDPLHQRSQQNKLESPKRAHFSKAGNNIYLFHFLNSKNKAVLSGTAFSQRTDAKIPWPLSTTAQVGGQVYVGDRVRLRGYLSLLDQILLSHSEEYLYSEKRIADGISSVGYIRSVVRHHGNSINLENSSLSLENVIGVQMNIPGKVRGSFDFAFGGEQPLKESPVNATFWTEVNLIY